MRYITALRLLLIAVPIVLVAPAASAQGVSSLDSFSLGPLTRPSAPQKPQRLDKIVAVVNDGVILESELDAQVAQVRQQSGGRADRLPRNVLRSQILDHMIMERLQVQRAHRHHIKVNDSELNKGMAQIAKKNGMTMQQFTQAVTRSGMNMQDLRQRVRQEILISKLRRQEVMSKVVVSDTDVNQYLENQSLRGAGKAGDSGHKVMVQEVKMRHILLKPNEIRNGQRTRKLARQIHERLEAGDSFAALARQYSDDSATANQGGDLGWVRIARLDPRTQRHINALGKGQISRVFQDPSGYEILKVENRRQRDETQQARRNKARQALGEQRSSEQGQLWLRKLRDEAYVDIRMANYQPTTGH